MSDLIKAIILGIVEGITEFLPISSTGHLIVVSAFLNFETDLADGTFEIFIQLGAILAVVWYYWGEIWQQIRSVRTDTSTQRLWLYILVAFIPAAVIGILLREWIKEVLFSPVVVAASLIIGGVIILLVERFLMPPAKVDAEDASDQTHDLSGLTLRQAVVVGIAQTFALIPGVSRSAASIIGGMFGGLDRPTATKFSFFLAIPTLGGATVFDLVSEIDTLTPNDLFYLVVATIVSAVVAWLSIRWLLRFVASNSFIPFGYYRIAAGAVILVLIATGLISTTGG